MELGVTDPVPALNAPAVAYQSQQGLWGGAQAGVAPRGAPGELIQVLGLNRSSVSGADSGHLHNSAGANPALADVLQCLLCPQRPGDAATMADLLIRCHKWDRALSLELAGDLAMQCLLVGSSLLFEKASPTPSGGSRLPAPGGVEKRSLGVERICLDQHAFETQLAEELFDHRPLVVIAGGVAGLADGYAQGGGVERHLGNECRTATGGGLDRAPQRLSIIHQLIKIGCTTWDLGDRPVPDRSAESCHVHQAEEVAEGGIGGRAPEFDAQRLCEHAVVADGKTLQIPQALATAQDPQHRHQQQIPGRNADPTPHPGVRNRLEKADLVEIGGGKSGFEHGQGAIPPTSTHADSNGQGACDTF